MNELLSSAQQQLQKYLIDLLRTLDESLIGKLDPKIILEIRKLGEPPEIINEDNNTIYLFENYRSKIKNTESSFPCDGKYIFYLPLVETKYIDDVQTILFVIQLNEDEQLVKGKSSTLFLDVLIERYFLRIARHFLTSLRSHTSINLSLLWHDHPLLETLRAVATLFIFIRINESADPFFSVNSEELQNGRSGFYLRGELFDDINTISTLLYEGEKSAGRLVFISVKNTDSIIEMDIKFENLIAISEHRKVRKILNLSNSNNNNFLVLEYKINQEDNNKLEPHVCGIGKLKESQNSDVLPLLVIDFKGHYHWELGYFDQSHKFIPILSVKNGKVSFPKEKDNKESFDNRCKEVFNTIEEAHIDNLWKYLKEAIEQKHGTMLVILDSHNSSSIEEARRLGKHFFKIQPKIVDEKQIQKLTSIDGSLLLLSNGQCHATGVILDGKVTEQEDSSRGARYNSAIRYSQSIRGKINHLIVVISEDGMIDFIS